MASQMRLTGDELNALPVSRPGEILEAVPGLIVTQHSGEGKANQYFLRGYNLDHGTDLAIWVDDVPINMRTHAHGQGYADLNWLMPETVNSVEVRKGPYFADEGDFGSAGNLRIGLIDSVNKSIAEMTVGSFGYERVFGMGSTKMGEGTLFFAGEAGAYNGPWVSPDDMRKISTMLRYSQGTAQDGLSITGMAYSNRWNSTDQVPERAITSGQIGLYGEEDPTDGGNTDRFALSARMAGTDDAGSWKANAYVVKSDLDLFNNFTYFLTNPAQGDQFHQHDSRVMAGANASRTLNGTFAGRLMETTFGVQTRNDDIDLGLLSNRLVRDVTVALSRCESSHRRQRIPFASNQHIQCSRRLSVRKWMADPARRAQSAEHQGQPNNLRLRIADQDRQPLQSLLPRSDGPCGGMSERRHGLCFTSDRAFGD